MLGQRSSKRVAFTCSVGQDSNSSMVKSQLEEEAHKGDTVLGNIDGDNEHVGSHKGGSFSVYRGT